MSLVNLLTAKKSAVFERWFAVLMESYPADTAGFLKNPKKQFANPVGYTLSKALDLLFEELIKEEFDTDKLKLVLDDIIRIRAIQDLSPSQSLTFVFHLKRVVREEIGGEGTAYPEELAGLDARIDATALIAFDLYMKCREKVYELRAKEVQNRTYRLLKMANLVSEVPEE